MRTPRLALLSLIAAALAGAASPATAAPPARQHPRPAPDRLAAALEALPGSAARAVVGSGLPLAFLDRPRADGVRGLARAQDAAPVVVRLKAPPSAADLDALRAAGAVVQRRRDGSPRGRGAVVLARATLDAIPALAALPQVARVTLDGAPFRPPPPLDATAAETQASAAWRPRPETGSLTGAGVTVCDVDSGIDPFHPLFFRADGGFLEWIDVDGDGVFTPGVDGVDRDGDGAPEILRVLDSVITAYYDDVPRFESEDPGYAMGLDWLYADLDGSGARELGPEAGFTEADPTYGEPLYVPDDVDGDGALEPGERLVALGSSKIRAVWRDEIIYRRGENLIELPRDEEIAHGTGAAGVMVGGNPGLTRLAGMAPGAEVVSGMLSEVGDELTLTDFCLEEGARVVLHEYAPWVGHHLDGSSELEQLIDETAQQGVVHVNPAGNLSGADKLSKHVIPAGATVSIPIVAGPDNPYGDFTLMAMSWLWRAPDRSPAMMLRGPDGVSMDVTVPEGPFLYEDWGSEGHKVYAVREDSDRGTARVDLYVFSEGDSPPPIPLGSWTLEVTNPGTAGEPPLELVGYVLDELSGWGKGIHFGEGVTEDHLIGYPGTADLGMAVAATTGHGFLGGTPGARAGYSGRGHRIDGAPLLWISAPDDPITSGYRPGREALHIIYGGTSGASPHVAGAAALLLEADPGRTGVDVREAIRAGALADEAVGAAPNDDYGHGKLRVYRSLFGEDPPGGGPPALAPVKATIPAEVEAAIPLEASDPDEPVEALTFDVDREYDGIWDAQLDGPTLRVTYPVPGQHTLKLRVRDAAGREASALAIIEVVERPAALVASGGCALGSGEDRQAWMICAGSALALLLRRRRRQ